MRDLNLKIQGVVDVFNAAASHVAADAHHADASSSPTIRKPEPSVTFLVQGGIAQPWGYGLSKSDPAWPRLNPVAVSCMQ